MISQYQNDALKLTESFWHSDIQEQKRLISLFEWSSASNFKIIPVSVCSQLLDRGPEGGFTSKSNRLSTKRAEIYEAFLIS